MKNFVERTIFWLYAVLMFATPLLFSKNTAELYEFPKMMFVYLVASTIVTLFLLRGLLFGFEKFVKPNILITLYLLAVIISVIFSSHTYTSVWGYYSRFNGGFMSYLAFFSLYLVGINFLDKKRIESVLEIALLSVLPVSLYAIFQAFTVERVFSTLGQPNWLAAYLVFLIPMLVGQAKKRGFWWFVVGCALLALWFTHSLSGLLGLLVVAAYGFRSKKWLLIAGLIGLVVVSSFMRGRIMDALNFSTDSASYNVSDPGLIRLGLWRGTGKMSVANAKNFLVGIGPETFPYEYPFYRDDVLNYSSEWDFILNKPHNFLLEVLVESGVVALVLYLVVFMRFLKTKNKYLVAGMLGFFVTNLFGWPTVSTSLIFWMWLVFSQYESLDSRFKCNFYLLI